MSGVIELDISLTLIDGEKITVRPTFGTFCKFEQEHGKGMKGFAEEGRLTDLAWITWEACRHQKKNVPERFEDFIDQVESIEVANDAPLSSKIAPSTN